MDIENLFAQLEKLKISGYPTADRRGVAKESMTVMFNPTSFSRSFSNKFEIVSTLGGKSKEANYSHANNEQLTLELIFDGTGVSEMGLEAIPGLGNKLFDVQERVEQFKALCYDLIGPNHEPNYLRLEWGSALKFECRLQSMNVTYTLFDNSGNPLRAKLSATFVEALDPEKAAKTPETQSSDLTKAIQVKMEDTLLLLTQQEYGSIEYFTWVARYNDLDQFRQLKPGSQLIFPPLETLKAKYERG